MLSTVSFSSSTKSLHFPSLPTDIAFTALDDELHDARRVLSQGQEEDLRYALERALGKVEELSSLLKTALKTQTELETQLNLAKSNLQLVISNNEMLEEALKRETPCNTRDVGWRRWSAREVQNYNSERHSEERHRSLDYGSLNESGTPAVPSNPPVVHENGAKSPTQTGTIPQSANSTTTQENRFFKFRFSSGTRSPVPSSHPPHLTSPSLSSLVPNAREKEMEELQEQLERERQAHKAADAAKAALETELESLSQALFEEANKMVASERMKRAETEEELHHTRLEKEALHQALKLIEIENGQLRSASPLNGTVQSEPIVSLAFSSSPEPPSPRPPRSPTGKVTSLVTAPYAITGGLADHRVHVPTVEPSLHRKTASMEKVDMAGPSLTEPLPVIGNELQVPVPLAPDGPSPWADVASS